MRRSAARTIALVMALICATASITPRVLHAQSEPASRRPGLVIAGPSTVGLSFPITTRLTLRPDLALSRTTFKVGGSETKFVSVGVGLGLLIHLGGDDDRLRTYVTPRVALTRNTYDDGSFADQWFADAAFGASAPVAKRLALFGEFGPRLTYTDQSTAALINRTTGVVLRSALGATFSF